MLLCVELRLWIGRNFLYFVELLLLPSSNVVFIQKRELATHREQIKGGEI